MLDKLSWSVREREGLLNWIVTKVFYRQDFTCLVGIVGRRFKAP